MTITLPKESPKRDQDWASRVLVFGDQDWASGVLIFVQHGPMRIGDSGIRATWSDEDRSRSLWRVSARNYPLQGRLIQLWVMPKPG